MSVTEKRTELLVGLFVFIGLAIMAVLVLQFGRFEDRLRGRYPLHVVFSDATGIFAGVDVRLGGVKIGKVPSNPHPGKQFNGVVVDLEIFEDFQIPNNALFTIRTAGLMGDNYVGIQVPDAAAGGFLMPDAYITGEKGGDLQALARTAEKISLQTEGLITEISEAVVAIRGGIENLNNALAKIDSDLLSEENLGNVRSAFIDLRDTSASLKATSAKIGPVLDEAHNAVANATTTFENTSQATEKIGPILDEFKKTAENANATVARLANDKGLLGALLNDPQLKDDFSALISNLREHGVLRYKDSAAEESSPGEARSEPPAKKRFKLFRR
ncbi:MAG: MlaD family protein [Verrucomicrobiales bacterium]